MRARDALAALAVAAALAAGQVSVVHADPPWLSPGANRVTLLVENEGPSEARQVNATLAARGLSLDASAVRLGDIGPKRTSSFVLEAAPDGSAGPSVSVSLEWLEADGGRGASPAFVVPFGLAEAERRLEVSSVYPTTVAPGRIANLVVQVRNRSEREATGVVLTVGAGGFRVLDGPRRALGSIPAGERRSAAFEAYFPLDSAGFVELPIRLDHDSGSDELSVGVLSAPLLALELANVVMPQGAAPGRRAAVSFDVVNLGDQSVRSAVVRARAEGASLERGSTFLGVVAAQESRRVTLDLVPERAAAGGNASVEVVLGFRDLSGDEHEQRLSRSFPVEAEAAPPAAPPAAAQEAPKQGLLDPTAATLVIMLAALLVMGWMVSGYLKKLRSFERELSTERDQLTMLEEEEERDMRSLKQKVSQLETVEFLVSEVERIPVARIMKEPRRLAGRLVAVGDHVKRVGEEGKHSLVEVSDHTGTVKGLVDGPVKDGPGTTLSLVRVEGGAAHLEVKTILRER